MTSLEARSFAEPEVTLPVPVLGEALAPPPVDLDPPLLLLLLLTFATVAADPF